MTQQKVFVGIFITILLGVIVFGVMNQKRESSDFLSSPSPSDNLFNSHSSNDPNSLSVKGTQTSQLQSDNKQDMPQMKSKQYPSYPGDLSEQKRRNKKAIISTKKGNIEFEIYPEATKAASNFIFLAEDNFYDSLTFHRVEKGFVIQGGDPLGNGRGGPGYMFEDDPVTKPYKKGTVAMANSGPNTNGSQFFIVLSDNPPLEPKYSIFGQVIKGMEVVEAIQKGDAIDKVIITSN